jgi:hypothetical protein
MDTNAIDSMKFRKLASDRRWKQGRPGAAKHGRMNPRTGRDWKQGRREESTRTGNGLLDGGRHRQRKDRRTGRMYERHWRGADSKPQHAAGRTTDEESQCRASSSCLKTNGWRQRLWKMLQREMCRQELGEPRLGYYTNTPDYYTLTRALL